VLTRPNVLTRNVQVAHFAALAGEPFRFLLAFFPALFLSLSVRTSGLVRSW
jgi:hypothetical protein